MLGASVVDAGERATATMEPGDNLCAYTDGVIEIRNADSEFFGPERLRDLIRGSRCDQAPAIVKRCLDEARAVRRRAGCATTRRSSYCADPSSMRPRYAASPSEG